MIPKAEVARSFQMMFFDEDGEVANVHSQRASVSRLAMNFANQAIEAYQDGGEVKHRPFHSYTMKQAIQEGFIGSLSRIQSPS